MAFYGTPLAHLWWSPLRRVPFPSEHLDTLRRDPPVWHLREELGHPPLGHQPRQAALHHVGRGRVCQAVSELQDQGKLPKTLLFGIEKVLLLGFSHEFTLSPTIKSWQRSSEVGSFRPRLADRSKLSWKWENRGGKACSGCILFHKVYFVLSQQNSSFFSEIKRLSFHSTKPFLRAPKKFKLLQTEKEALQNLSNMFPKSSYYLPLTCLLTYDYSF